MQTLSQRFHGGNLEHAARAFGRPDFIDFSSSVNVFAQAIPASQWAQWISQIFKYPEPDAHAVRARLAGVHALAPEQILPTAGAIEALYLAARLFDGRKVAIVEPAFSDYARAFDAAGIEVNRIVLTPRHWHSPPSDWAELLEPFDVVVFGNPNNPTGRFHSKEQIAALLARAWGRPKCWLVDEAFIEFVPDHERETLLTQLAHHRSLMVVRSLTKSWCIPGLRLGFLATSNPAWMNQLRRMQPPWSINAIAHAWAQAFLDREHSQQLISTLAELRKIRARFALDLSRLDGVRVHPAAANFLLIELIDSTLNAAAIYEALGREGLLVRVCDSFHGMPPGRFLRVAVRREVDNHRLVQALATLLPPRGATAA